MINKELYDILINQNKILEDNNKTLLGTIDKLTNTISSLENEISELKKMLKKDSLEKEKLASKLNGLSKIALPKKTEKVVSKESKTPAPTPKERGNNGAKRKVLDIEEVITDVYPNDDPSFEISQAKLITTQDVIRYEFTPAKLVKHIYRIHKYSQDGEIIEGKAPMTSLLNSSYSSSFIAYLIQQRYVYSMPVERIMRYLHEMNVDITKSCLHNLLKRAAEMLDRLNPVLKEAILESQYIHFDETYHQLLDKEASGGSRKAYFWVALAHDIKLINLFYEDGSRSSKVFKSYLPNTYRGAIQTDGYATYKIVEEIDYLNTIRLGCIQHCKRKFLEIENEQEAKQVIDFYNEFYQIRKIEPKEKWIILSKVVFEKLEKKLREVEKDIKTITNTKLRNAVSYCLNELGAIENIISSTEYDLDNNEIERPMRYISLSRKNSLFCGSNKGAERSALIYSLAISCRLNNVNTYDYFNDIIMLLAKMPPNTSNEKLREILPDKWAKI